MLNQGSKKSWNQIICSHCLCSHLDDSPVLTPNRLQTSALTVKCPLHAPSPGLWLLEHFLVAVQMSMAFTHQFRGGFGSFIAGIAVGEQTWETASKDRLRVCAAQSLCLIFSCWFLWELPNQLSYSTGMKPNEKYSFLHCKHDCQALMFFSASF